MRREEIMKTIFISMIAVAMIATSGAAQSTSQSLSADSEVAGAVKKKGGSIDLRSGATVTGQLQGSLNAEKARVGDEVVLKTTRAVKQNGRTIIEKGSRLVGRVTEIKQKSRDRAGSEIGVVFDSLKQGDTLTPITATILSVTKVASAASVDSTAGGDLSVGSSRSTTSSTSQSGGLLGGATSSVNGVVNTTTSTVGSVTNSAANATEGFLNTTGQAAGSTTGALGSNIRGLQISTSSDASANGTTTLSMNSGNLKLDSGTTFTLNIASAASAPADDQ